VLAKDFWFKVHRLEEVEREADATRRAKFRETNDPGALEGQNTPEGLFMTTLENDERCTVGGTVCAIQWKFVGIKLAEKTHRRSTAQEIAGEFQRQEAYMVVARKQEDALNNRRTISGARPNRSPGVRSNR
jgi:hypothetical protein